jgi:hypothetical protein
MDMKKETKTMSLVIVAVAALCLLSVAAASPTTATAAPHSKGTGVKSGATVGATYTLTLQSSATSYQVDAPFSLYGYLLADGSGVSGATVGVISEQPGGSWSQITSFHTNSDGYYKGKVTVYMPGTYYYETFYGDTYSNAVIVSV